MGSFTGNGVEVYVSENTSNIRRSTRREILWHLVSLAGLGLVAAGIVNVVLLRLVARPVRQLSDTVVCIAQGDYGAATNGLGSRELSELASAINDMSETLATNERNRNAEMEKGRQIQGMLKSLSKSREEIRRQNQELEQLATLDPLTSCLNRRSFFGEFETQWKHAVRNDRPLSCVMMDIDHFKSINDSHGHSMGDQVLRQVSNTLRKSVRPGDFVCRYGGEEFCILLPNSNLEEATQFAERYRLAIAELSAQQCKVTASFGASSISLGASSPQSLLDESDKALYVAKRNGRNQVVRWDQAPTHGKRILNALQSKYLR